MATKNTRLAVGDRTYEMIRLVSWQAPPFHGAGLLKRADEVGADAGPEDKEYLLAHHAEIPPEQRLKFVLPKVPYPVDGRYVLTLVWYKDEMKEAWRNMNDDYGPDYFLLRRVV
ncbi:MAG: hypothetical protein WC822_06225 [Candidatus Paceibacterota bacterium]|jgi:hypothetical protein